MTEFPVANDYSALRCWRRSVFVNDVDLSAFGTSEDFLNVFAPLVGYKTNLRTPADLAKELGRDPEEIRQRFEFVENALSASGYLECELTYPVNAASFVSIPSSL